MADTITELASKCGISPDMAKKGLGTLLAAFKHALPAESFAKIESAIPGASDMVAEAQEQGTAPLPPPRGRREHEISSAEEQ